MDKSNSQNEKPKEERRYDPELLKKGLRCDLDQYEMLKRCSDKKDLTEWNEWRKKHPKKDILLEGADLKQGFLRGANLGGGVFVDNTGKQQRFHGDIHLEGTNLHRAYLEGAELYDARLPGVDLRNAHLENANLKGTRLEGANFRLAHLQSAVFRAAIVDGSTLLWQCEVNRHTEFTGVGLNSVRIDPGTKQLLEYNIRRKNWERWYRWRDWHRGEPAEERSEAAKIWRWLVRLFWWASDYGRSTGRIVRVFFVLAIVFALFYWLLPSLVMVNGEVGEIRGLWHAFYFSVVTMTTLGFGDIAANPDSWLGQTLLMLQVILGYALLGALVTRFAVLFTAGGPAGKFARRTRDRPCPKPKTGWDELVADKTVLQTGDVIHVQNRGLLSKLIRFFSRADDEEPSWASHSAMVLRVGEEIEIIEALWRTVIRPITAYKGKKSKLLVCRKPGGIEEEQKQKMIEKAEYYKGKKYGYLKIAFHVLDRFLNNRYVFRRLIKDNKYPICSWLVAYVYDRVLKYHFGAPPNAAQPDDLLDHCLDYDWEFIWADSGESVADFCRTYKLSDKNDVA